MPSPSKTETKKANAVKAEINQFIDYYRSVKGAPPREVFISKKQARESGLVSGVTHRYGGVCVILREA